MRHALSIAMQDFSGAIILVSHDRHLLKTTVDELYLVRGAALVTYDGDLADYARWLRNNQGNASPSTAEASGTPHEAVVSDAVHTSALPKTSSRRLSYKDKRELEQLPARIEQLEHRQQGLQEQLSQPNLYQGGGDQVAKVKGELDEVERCLEHAFLRWGELE